MATKQQPRKVLGVFGTRPEAIKMAPVMSRLRDLPGVDSKICVTGQHREMLDQVLAAFGMKPDFDLNLMRSNQGLADLTARVLTGIAGVYGRWRPDLVLVQGDTTTVMAAAMAAFYEGIDVGHVEAGLRSGNLHAPWPEEMNRKVVAVMTRYHFAPTRRAADALRDENYPEERIFVTGNTVIDALLEATQRVRDAAVSRRMAEKFPFLEPQRRMILVTGHRRENFGGGFEEICRGLRRVAAQPDVDIVYPVHLNPNVHKPVHALLGDCANIHLVEPQDYLTFVWLMDRSLFVITDSGGVQEEAPTLGKPVLVTRAITERPEAVEAGAVRLVGTDADRIRDESLRLLTDEAAREAMGGVRNPYGDGKASERIAAIILGETPEPFIGATD